MTNITDEKQRLYTFNRRVVSDQIIYVRASSEAEARQRARAENVEQTCDESIVKTTLRRIEDHP